MLSIDLNGTWQLQPDWQSLRIGQVPDTLFGKDEWILAKVPGTVHTDLLAAGKIADPFYRDNECQVQWVAEIGWRWRRSFQVPAELLTSHSIQFVAEGIDTFAVIFINGRRVAETSNMFIPHRVEVKSLLRTGENEIEIRVDSPIQRTQELETRHGKLLVPLESCRVYARKAQYSFGWDWGPKLATSGIWRPIRLEGFHQLRLGDVFSDVHLDDNLQCAHVSVKIVVDRFSTGAAEFAAEISGPDFHARKHAVSTDGIVLLEFTIDRPRLWWPNGCGDQPLYTMKVTANVDGKAVDERISRFGIRKLELLRKKDSEGESFLFCINNVPVFCKGANWIPADSFLPRVGEEKYRSLLTMARECHINMLRVWGGGIYEQKVFYDLCDELGIMVWQDFMFACGVYPEYSEFVDNVRQEVATIVKQLRNHPCIALWCGNNENEWWWHMKTKRPLSEMPGASLFERTIPEVCAVHDSTRPYCQSSPFGGEDPNDKKQGDHHQWDIWGNWADVSAVTKNRCRFASEFGFQAPAGLSAWKKSLDSQDMWPQSPVFEHHNKQIEGSERLYRYLAGWVKMPESFEDFVYKAQIVQAEALKSMVEYWRCEKSYTGGALFWQLNDCWPVASWAVIDSELQPKAAYWYARRFFAPLLLSFKRVGATLEVWAINDMRAACKAELQFEILNFSGEISLTRLEHVSIPADVSFRVLSIELDGFSKTNLRQQYARARLQENDHILAENRYFFTRYKHLELENPQIDCQLERIDSRRWGVRVKADRFAKSLALLTLPNGATPTDNYFDLDANSDTMLEIRNFSEERDLQANDLQWKWLS